MNSCTMQDSVISHKMTALEVVFDEMSIIMDHGFL